MRTYPAPAFPEVHIPCFSAVLLSKSATWCPGRGLGCLSCCGLVGGVPVVMCCGDGYSLGRPIAFVKCAGYRCVSSLFATLCRSGRNSRSPFACFFAQERVKFPPICRMSQRRCPFFVNTHKGARRGENALRHSNEGTGTGPGPGITRVTGSQDQAPGNRVKHNAAAGQPPGVRVGGGVPCHVVPGFRQPVTERLAWLSDMVPFFWS